MRAHSGPTGVEVWGEFIDFLKRQYDFKPNERQKRAIFDFIVETGHHFCDRRAFDKARLRLWQMGVLPAYCITESEKRSLKFDAALEQIDTNQRDSRQKVSALAKISHMENNADGIRMVIDKFVRKTYERTGIVLSYEQRQRILKEIFVRDLNPLDERSWEAGVQALVDSGTLPREIVVRTK